MAVSYVDEGTVAAGTTSLTVPCPATVAAGNLLVLVIANKYPTNGPSQPTGWTTPSNNQYSGGAGAAGVDSGNTYITIFTREADGTEGGTNVSVTLTGANTSLGRIFRFSKTAGSWGIAIAGGGDNSAGTAWSVTSGADPGVASGDIILVASALNGNTDTGTSQAISQSGATFDTMAERQDSGTNNGEDCSLIVTTHPVITGGTGNLTYTMTVGGTGSSTAAGSTAFVRVREVSSGVTVDGISLTATATLSVGIVDFTVTDGGVNYLLRDKFTTAQNPLVDGAASLIGTRDVTGSLWKALGGRLRGGQQLSTPTWGNSAVVYGGLDRKGGRTLWALVTPQDGEAEIFFGWQTSATAGNPTADGYGFLIDNAAIHVSEPGRQVTVLNESKPGHAQQYLMGVTLNEGQGAVYWLSTFAAQSFGGEWTIPAFPDARIVYVSTAGTNTVLYPTVSALSGYTYPDGHAVEDIRVVDVSGWAGADGLATLSDRFNRADNASDIGGSGWTTEASSTWGINTNRAYTSSATFNGRVYKTGAPTDGFMVGTVSVGAALTDWFGWLVRRSDANNWLRLYNNGSANTYLQSWVAGGFGETIWSTGGLSWAINTTYRLAMAYQGNQYRFWRDGQSYAGDTVITDSNSRFTTATGFGLFGDDADSYHDNWAVYPSTITLPTNPFGSTYGAVPYSPTVGGTSNSDTFTDTDGTNLTAHTPDTGGSWSVSAGTWTINASNQLTVAPAAGENHAYVAAGGADKEISATFTTPASLAVGQIRQGFILRRADADNFVIIRMFMDDASQPGSDEIEVQEIIGASGNVVRKCYLGNFWAANTTYTLKAQVVGDVLQVFLDGQPHLTVHLSNSALLSGQGFGFYRDSGTDALLMDAFTVKSIGSADVTVTGESLSASISTSYGSVTGASDTTGTSLSAAVSVSYGAVTGDAGATGVEIGATVGFTAGAVDTSVSVAGAAISASASGVYGDVSGASDTTGTSLSATTSLVVGSVDTGGSASVDGAAFDVTIGVSYGTIITDAAIAGEGFSASAGGSYGAVSTGVSLDGAALAATASLVVGSVDVGGSATADGATLSASISVIFGIISTETINAGIELVATVNSSFGAVSGDVSITGIQITCNSSLNLGVVSTEAIITGLSLTSTISSSFGVITGSAAIAGAALGAAVSTEYGAVEAGGSITISGASLSASAALAIGAVYADVTISGIALSATISASYGSIIEGVGASASGAALGAYTALAVGAVDVVAHVTVNGAAYSALVSLSVGAVYGTGRRFALVEVMGGAATQITAEGGTEYGVSVIAGTEAEVSNG